ncbi:hypothetical protein GGI12_002972 [Dipsacomyces acuminosporus]|nr:hypothetical protein GGI12_002972 [Dipsacomyces acuminosporus]
MHWSLTSKRHLFIFGVIGQQAQLNVDSVSPIATLVDPLKHSVSLDEAASMWGAGSVLEHNARDVYWFGGLSEKESQPKDSCGAPGEDSCADLEARWAGSSGSSAHGSQPSGVYGSSNDKTGGCMHNDGLAIEQYSKIAGNMSSGSAGETASFAPRSAVQGAQTDKQEQVQVQVQEWEWEREQATADSQSIEGELAGCVLNPTRGDGDMYTPRWIRGVGKAKEGLCPVCYSDGLVVWKRMKCSAYW